MGGDSSRCTGGGQIGKKQLFRDKHRREVRWSVAGCPGSQLFQGQVGLVSSHTWFPRSHSLKPAEREEGGSQSRRVLWNISTFVLERKFIMPEGDEEYFGKNGNALFAWVFFIDSQLFSVCTNFWDEPRIIVLTLGFASLTALKVNLSHEVGIGNSFELNSSSGIGLSTWLGKAGCVCVEPATAGSLLIMQVRESWELFYQCFSLSANTNVFADSHWESRIFTWNWINGSCSPSLVHGTACVWKIPSLVYTHQWKMANIKELKHWKKCNLRLTLLI